MSESASTGTRAGRRGLLITCAIVVTIVAIFVISLYLGQQNANGEAFGGTDSAATEIVEAAGHKPWFKAIFTPGSAEIESGLFALQAAIGAGVLGFVLGWFRAKHKFSSEK